MKTNTIFIFLIILVAAGFYFLGKKNGAASEKTTLTENVHMIKLIAELGALDVMGNLNMKVSNKGDEAGNWERFKNYLAENTLQVSLPFEAKFGVNLRDQNMNIDTKAGTATVSLPHAKMISLQLQMDKMETMSQTGIFTRATMNDLVKAQKQLYADALQKIQNDPKYIKLAEDHITSVLSNYYAPLNYKVKCIFGEVRQTALQ